MSDSILASVLGRRPPKRKLSIGAIIHADPSAPPAKRSGVATQGGLGVPLSPVAYSTTGSTPHVASDTYGTISHSIAGGHGNSNYMFSGAVQLNVHHTPSGVPDGLKNATAYAAFHNSADRGDPPRCHKNTRLAILKKIMDWIRREDPATKDCFVMWMHGPAGSGKTAIAQTIAERLHEPKLLLASYFFGRLDPSRNHSGSLIITIAFQMALYLPDEVRERITVAVNRDPHIFRRSLGEQINSLIVHPLQPLIEKGYFNKETTPRVIIIDGLDECADRKQQVAILRSIGGALRKHHLPILFFIASRPELEIRGIFDSGLFQGFLTQLALDNNYQAYEDVECFLSDQFKEIKQTHPLAEHIPVGWPAQDMVLQLVWRSSGQFIYASTAIKFVESWRHHPHKRLDIILGLRAPQKDLPFAELDALYCQVFSNVEDWEKVSLVLAFHVLQPKSRNYSRERIEVLLGLECGDISLLFCDLGSAIELDEKGLRFHHASIPDFLLDKSRSGDFHIDAPTAHARLAQKLLQFFQNCWPFQLEAEHGQAVDLQTLSFHIERAAGSEELERDIRNFDFLRLFEPEFPRHAVYSIPEYISALEKLGHLLQQLPNEVKQQRGTFLTHIKEELKVYCQDPDLNFLLVCFHEGESLLSYTDNVGPRLGDTLRLRGTVDDYVSFKPLWTAPRDQNYKEILQDILKDAILDKNYTFAALYLLKTVFPRQGSIQWPLKWEWIAPNPWKFLEKAGHSEELINYIQNLPWPLMITVKYLLKNIDVSVQDYFARMDIFFNQDYTSLALYALKKMLELPKDGDNEDMLLLDLETLLNNSCYLLEKAGRSEELIDYVQHFPLQHILGLGANISSMIDKAFQDYLERMNIVSDRDYTSFALHGLGKLSDLLHKNGWLSLSEEVRLHDLSSICVYMLEKAGQSLELIDLVQQLKSTSWPMFRFIPWTKDLGTDEKILYDAFATYLRRTAPHEDSTPDVRRARNSRRSIRKSVI